MSRRALSKGVWSVVEQSIAVGGAASRRTHCLLWNLYFAFPGLEKRETQSQNLRSVKLMLACISLMGCFYATFTKLGNGPYKGTKELGRGFGLRNWDSSSTQTRLIECRITTVLHVDQLFSRQLILSITRPLA